MGRDTLLAARDAGAEIAGVVTLPGPIDPNRSGLARTGVTLFEIVDPTADSGPILGQVVVPVAVDETATTLFDKLARAHVDLVRDFVPRLRAGTVTETPQDSSRASAWPKRTPADGIIDWETRAPYLYDWVR